MVWSQVCRWSDGWCAVSWARSSKQSFSTGARRRTESVQHVAEPRVSARLSWVYRRHGECVLLYTQYINKHLMSCVKGVTCKHAKIISDSVFLLLASRLNTPTFFSILWLPWNMKKWNTWSYLKCPVVWHVKHVDNYLSFLLLLFMILLLYKLNIALGYCFGLNFVFLGELIELECVNRSVKTDFRKLFFTHLTFISKNTLQKMMLTEYFCLGLQYKCLEILESRWIFLMSKTTSPNKSCF